MTNVFARLYTNARLFPRFAALVAVVYLLTGLAIGIPVSMASHSISRGIAVAILVLSACMFGDFLTYFVIAANPAWYSKCIRAADAFADIFLRTPIVEENETDEEPEDYTDGDEFAEEDELIEDEEIDPNEDALNQVEDLRDLDKPRKCADCKNTIPKGQALCDCNTSGDLG